MVQTANQTNRQTYFLQIERVNVVIRWIIIAVLSVGLVGTGVWGYQEHQEKNAILVQAENEYQRAFHELTYHMDLLNNELGAVMAMNSSTGISPKLADIWRISSDALSNVGQLPLGLLPFNKTEEFLSNISDFTYRTAVRDLNDDPLTKEESEAIAQLYEQSGEIKNELRKVQHLALENDLRWMDVQVALANNDEMVDNTIIDGLKTVEDTVEGYQETNVDSSIIGVSSKDHSYKNIKGKEITKEEALEAARELFQVNEQDELSITTSGDGADIPFYSISYQNDHKRGYMDMSVQGGLPMTLLVDREVDKAKLSLNRGMEIADQYLKKLQFEDMQMINSSQYDNIGVYSYLYVQDDVRVYPDSLEVKVALDNGDILGLTARNYLMNHHERDIPDPEVSVEEAKEAVNPNVDIQEEYLAIIDNDLGEEVLVYEFMGIYNDQTYRIFINAIDGKEEKVELLNGTEVDYNFAQG